MMTDKPIRILIFTPVWKRAEIFRICLKGIKRLQEYNPARFQIKPFFIVSESWAAHELMKLNLDFIFSQNDPLGNKKNTGLKYAVENYEFDYLLEIGSDDLITSEYLDLIEPLMNANTPQFNTSSVYFIDICTGKPAFWETSKVLGAGRCISRIAIEKALKQGPLWNPEGTRGMDTFSWRQLAQVGIINHIIETNEVYALDIKSQTNINPIENFSKSPLKLNEILDHFPEAGDIRKLIQSFNLSILQ